MIENDLNMGGNSISLNVNNNKGHHLARCRANFLNKIGWWLILSLVLLEAICN